MEAANIRRRPSYPAQTRLWAVAMARTGQYRQADVAQQVGCCIRQLRRWIKDADTEDGLRPGLKPSEVRELHLLRRVTQRQQERIHLLEEARDFFATETR